MSKKNVEIKGLNLQIGKKEIQLTIADAKKLHEALNEIFKQEVVVQDHHHYDHWRWTWKEPCWSTTGGQTVFEYMDKISMLNCSVNQ